MEFLSLSRLNLEYAVFATACVGLFAFLRAGLWRRRLHWSVRMLSWWAMVGILVGGKLAVHWANDRRWREMQTLVEGYAPAYAAEIEKLGHAQVSLNTPPDDPAYLKLIEAQKSWLARNPSVADIYTFRRDPVSGVMRFVVDSETDYDHNGRLEGAREARTSIGESYTGNEPEIEQAFFTRKPAFEKVEEEKNDSDRWGQWITGFAPVFGPDGQVEAVLGVDFDAGAWFQSLRQARYTMLCLTGFVMLAMCGLVSLIAILALTDENRRRRRETHTEREARQKFATLVNSIDGVVFEWNPEQHRFEYVSEQVTRILGYASTAFTGDAGFWRSKLPPEDCASVQEARAETARTGQPCRIEYRMMNNSGRPLWVREIGTPCVDESGKVTLIRGVLLEITAQRQAAEELEYLHSQVVESSRRAGMAEVATGVLHNVGNVLNSVNVSAGLIRERLRESRLPNLARIAEILHREEPHLSEFLGKDERGRMVPRYLEQLSSHLSAEQKTMLAETENLLRGVDHIRGIVGAQQRHASPGASSVERLRPADVAREACRLAGREFERCLVSLEEQFSRVPDLLTDRHRLLQILLNLLQNAAQAVSAQESQTRVITLSIRRAGRGRIRFVVSDTGIGIDAAHIGSIFHHGFTTRWDGHGFGLHSSALAAQGMGGSLTAASPGRGQGSVFTLTLPCDRRPRPRTSPSPDLSKPTIAYAQP